MTDALTQPTPAAPRQLILLCDGTNNNLTGQYRDTNVVKLGALLAADPDDRRLVFYDPGVGNPGELPGATTWDQLRRRLDRLAGLAFGRGVYENMAESYLFLMRHYQPGDAIYIFGFSRGAFTARSVAGVINQFGILQAHMESMLHIYFADRSSEVLRKAISQQTSRLFTDADSRRVAIQFVGVWDTVASVGMPPFGARITALPRPEGKCFVHVRQAMSLDEHRRQFKPRLYALNNGPFETEFGTQGGLQQLWFPGAHCDVGGGYEPARSALADTAFGWLVSEAVTQGLRLRADGMPLKEEAAVLNRLAQVYAPPPPGRAVIVHSEVRQTPLWAVTGLAVRETGRVVMDDDSAVPLQPEAHPSIDKHALNWRDHSVWAKARTPALVWCALLLLPLIALALGQLLYGAPQTGNVWGDIRQAFQLAPAYLSKNLEFQQWQLVGWAGQTGTWFNADWKHPFVQFASPRWALVWDLPFILAYATVLSWFVAWAFGRLAGLRRADSPPRPGLNLLGTALPATVGADVAEDVLTWLALTLGQQDVLFLAGLSHVLAACCSVLKFAGLAGVLWLVLWSAVGGPPGAAARVDSAGG